MINNTLKLNHSYEGFLLTRIEEIKEINGQAYLFDHEKSGARLLYVAADDSNKVFSISFRTPPQDSTGVAHIMEHSVLCGSRKFPLKEPFVELVKGSLNTFLNAMTYPDKTMYPVASKNDKDFHNLMDVYLDAVFYPRVATDSEIVMQEGWHYELEHREDPLIYKGVVFNEMKGVYSSPDSLLERHMMEDLFPDTTYGVESGGDPDFITDLSYGDFQNFYHKYYHPSNSYIFLYGKLDILEQLKFINEEYLQNFDRISVNSEIELQKPLTKGVVAAYPYGIASEESTDNKAYHSLTYVFSEMTPVQSLAFEVLTHALLTSPAAPLKQKLVKAGIGNDVSGYYLDSIRQPIWNITVTGSDISKQAELQQIVEDTLKELTNTGFDKTMLEASLNTIEFALREAEFGGRPIGLAYNIRVMDNWLYDRDPIELLRYEESLKVLRDGIQNGYFEELVINYILKNSHKALESIYPEVGLLEKKEQEEKDKLALIKSSMSNEELDEIIAKTASLKARQEATDSPEALATIPLLELSDLTPEVEKIERRESSLGKAKLHFIPTFANGINYVNYYFDLSVLSEEEVFYAELLGEILGQIGTEKYDYTTLSQEINLHLGGFSVNISAINKDGERQGYVPLMTVRVKGLHSKLAEMCHLSDEIMQHSVFTDTARLLEILKETKAVWDTEAFRRGNNLVSTRVLAQVTQSAKFQDQGELGFYQKLSHLLSELNDTKVKDLVTSLEQVSNKIFRAAHCNISFTGSETEFKEFAKIEEPLLLSWEQKTLPTNQLHITEDYVNEGIVTAGKVQYVAKGGNFLDHGFTFTGAMSVLETILRYEYLWIRIRVQGGAYGAFANFYNNGNVLFCSYRDPNLVESLTIYDEMEEYLRSFDISEREMTKYIIGTMSRLDLPMTPALRGPRAMGLYFRGVTEEVQTQLRREVINCKPNDIVALADVVKAVMADNHVCVMGNEQKIKDAGKIFSKVNPLN